MVPRKLWVSGTFDLILKISESFMMTHEVCFFLSQSLKSFIFYISVPDFQTGISVSQRVTDFTICHPFLVTVTYMYKCYIFNVPYMYVDISPYIDAECTSLGPKSVP